MKIMKKFGFLAKIIKKKKEKFIQSYEDSGRPKLHSVDFFIFARSQTNWNGIFLSHKDHKKKNAKLIQSHENSGRSRLGRVCQRRLSAQSEEISFVNRETEAREATVSCPIVLISGVLIFRLSLSRGRDYSAPTCVSRPPLPRSIPETSTR